MNTAFPTSQNERSPSSSGRSGPQGGVGNLERMKKRRPENGPQIAFLCIEPHAARWSFSPYPELFDPARADLNRQSAVHICGTSKSGKVTGRELARVLPVSPAEHTVRLVGSWKVAAALSPMLGLPWKATPVARSGLTQSTGEHASSDGNRRSMANVEAKDAGERRQPPANERGQTCDTASSWRPL
jgi:hypothetical protein